MKLVLILPILSVIAFSGPAVADDPAATKEATKLFVVATSTTGGIAVAAVGNFASAEIAKRPQQAFRPRQVARTGAWAPFARPLETSLASRVETSRLHRRALWAG